MKKLMTLLMCAGMGLALMQCTSQEGQKSTDELARNFATPPDDARIWVYWFWLNSNITREGITADLEAMKRAGVGGVLIMEVDQGAPVGPVDFMGDKWRELFKFMVTEADRLGIAVNMNNDAGWNGSGGPWVPLDKSMQVVSTSEMQVPAGKSFTGILPKPMTKSGYYKDITVLAFPAPVDGENAKYRIKDLSAKNMGWGGMYTGSLEAATATVIPAEYLIRKEQVIDLSSKMDSTGKLTWEAPALNGSPKGNWTVIRFGHTFTGAVCGPAPLSGQGPECDKLSKEGVEANYKGMIGKLVADVGPLAGKALIATHVDSWEVGSQNWTPAMRSEFQRLRGYEMTPYLPVLTGRIVESPEISERFLRDVRQTVSDLLAENYIGHLRTLANKDGLKLSMESYSTPANDLDVGNNIDEPISEFWWPSGGGFWWTQKAMSSLSHVNGLPITGAESFTSDNNERWLAHPALIKSLGDKAFCDGVNRFIVHRYAMQPWVDNRKPGMTMGPWGLHYERSNTWWEDSKAWHEYVARCQYMLRLGKFNADVLSLQSEEPLQRFKPLKLNGYDYDGISPQAFLKDATVKDGLISLPSGMTYRLLLLPGDKEMSPRMLGKIKQMVEEGATIAGTPPVTSAGLSGYPAAEDEIKILVKTLWGEGNEPYRKVGKGQVLATASADEALGKIGIIPDFLASRPMTFIHRTIGENEVYFIATAEPIATEPVCSFRVTGKVPEIWNPETGLITPITVYEESDGCTKIPLRFDPSGSAFIVFKKGGSTDANRVVSVKLDGRELVSFKAEPPAPEVKPKAVETSRSFTMAAWIKPDANIDLPDQANSGAFALGVERNDLIYAAPGHEVWTDKDAGAGISAGTNGICVTEHSANYFPALLVYPVPITGWTHVAVVYEDGTPALWINGKMVHKGLKSKFIVHGSLNVAHTRNVNPFNGQVSALNQYPVALKADEILNLVKAVPDTTIRVVAGPAYRFDSHEMLKNGKFEVRKANGKSTLVELTGLPDAIPVGGPWNLAFPAGNGAPDQVTLDKLISWTQHPDAGVRYFSGSATFTTKFSYTPVEIKTSGLQTLVYLDLGRVAVMADVTLNGRHLGLLWKSPYRINVTNALVSGENKLEVRVVNLMINRMIGDEQLPEDSERNPNGTLKKWPQWLTDKQPSPTGRYTFTSWRLWAKNSPLRESGLLGPVTLRFSAQINK